MILILLNYQQVHHQLINYNKFQVVVVHIHQHGSIHHLVHGQITLPILLYGQQKLQLQEVVSPLQMQILQ